MSPIRQGAVTERLSWGTTRRSWLKGLVVIATDIKGFGVLREPPCTGARPAGAALVAFTAYHTPSVLFNGTFFFFPRQLHAGWCEDGKRAMRKSPAVVRLE